MKKNNWKLGMGALAVMTALTGCGSGGALEDVTDEELDTAGEYAAITLLKYDAATRSRLVTLPEESAEEELAAEESAPTEETETVETPETAAEPEANGADTTVVDATETTASSIEEFLGLPEGITVAFAGQEMCESYADAEMDYLSIEASEGKMLVAARFVLANNSGEAQNIDLLSAAVSFRLTVNGDYTRTALTTMLPNDFANYSGTLEAGATQEVVILIEVNPEKVPTVSSLGLTLKTSSDSYTMQLI